MRIGTDGSRLLAIADLLLLAGCDMGMEAELESLRAAQHRDQEAARGACDKITDEASAKANQAELEEAAGKVRDIQERIREAEEAKAKRGKAAAWAGSPITARPGYWSKLAMRPGGRSSGSAKPTPRPGRSSTRPWKASNFPSRRRKRCCNKLPAIITVAVATVGASARGSAEPDRIRPAVALLRAGGRPHGRVDCAVGRFAVRLHAVGRLRRAGQEIVDPRLRANLLELARPSPSAASFQECPGKGFRGLPAD